MRRRLLSHLEVIGEEIPHRHDAKLTGLGNDQVTHVALAHLPSGRIRREWTVHDDGEVVRHVSQRRSIGLFPQSHGPQDVSFRDETDEVAVQSSTPIAPMLMSHIRWAALSIEADSSIRMNGLVGACRVVMSPPPGEEHMSSFQFDCIPGKAHPDRAERTSRLRPKVTRGRRLPQIHPSHGPKAEELNR